MAHRRLLVAAAALALAVLVVAPALADYLGPNRAVTTWVWRRLNCHYEAVYDPPGTGWYGCTLDLYQTPDSNCDSSSSVRPFFNPSVCSGWPGSCSTLPCNISRSSSTESCNEGQSGCTAVSQTITHPAATISGSLSCAVPGAGGWCLSGANLALAGSEPLAGFSILALEGTRNGEVFACPGASCGLPLVEGTNDFTFWALSSWGDSSLMGTASGRLDSQPPSVSGQITGTVGDNGWYVSDVTVSAAASDPSPGSGVSGLQVSLDGGGFNPYADPISLSDGSHALEFSAMDAAGLLASNSLTVLVDIQPPVLGLSADADFCPGCGETLVIAFDAQDSLSGVVAWTLSADGVLIASGSSPSSQTLTWDGSGLPAGAHGLSLQARDAAGNTSEATREVAVTAPAPPPPTSPPSRPNPTAPVPASAPTAVPTLAPTRSSPFTPTLGPAGSRRPTRTPSISIFGILPAAPPPEEAGAPPAGLPGPLRGPEPAVEGASSNVLWGAGAAALIAAATAMALDQAQRRREEEARVRSEMERRNAFQRAREQAERARLAAAAMAAAAARAEAEHRLTAGQILHQATGGERPSQDWLLEAAAAAELARLEALRRTAERRDGPPPPVPTATPTPATTATVTPSPSATVTPSPRHVQTPSPAATATPHPPERYRAVADTFPARGYRDPRDIPELALALRSGGQLRVPNGPLGLTGWLEWGESFAAEARTSLASAVSTGGILAGEAGQAPTVTQPWSLPLGPVTVSAQQSPQPSLSVSWRPRGILSAYPGGGAGVDFSSSVRITSEGRWLNNMWTLEYAPLDYRVTAGEGLAELPGYAGRAGVYVRVNPMRTMLVGSLVVGIALVAAELLPPLALLLPRLGEALSGAH